MAERPNVLWIYCDELRADGLQCYGNDSPPVQTPNLDRLAADGARFQSCFCNSPICVSSRTSALTGLDPEDTGVYCNEGFWPTYRMDRPVKTFPEVFADRGYTTANFGKVHVPRELQAWQHSDGTGAGMQELARACPGGTWTSLGEPDCCGVMPAGKPYPPERLTENALAFLAKAEGPFLLRASYLQPHTPVLPPAAYGDMYMDCPWDGSPPQREGLSFHERQWLRTWDERGYSHETMRAMRMRYYALCTWVDAQVGVLLAALEERGLAEDTIVLFTADHGCMAGDWGLSGKQLFHHWTHRVPLIVRWAGGVPAGDVREDICEGLDLARTLFGLAGIEPTAERFKGRDLFSEPAPDAVFSTIGYGFPGSRCAPYGQSGTYPGGRGWPRRACVRTTRYRFDKTVRIDGRPARREEEDAFLVDVETDPDETRNLAGDPALRAVVEDLSARIDAHVADSYEPPHRYCDPVAAGIVKRATPLH